MTRLFTLGFTKKDARQFFGLLTENHVKTLIDVRLHNVSQLAGFTKRDDLEFFLQEIAHISYMHIPDLAPTEEILSAVKKRKMSWNEYEAAFHQLLTARSAERLLERRLLEYSCLLCSEDSPEKCHRRLVADFFKEKLGGIEIIHL
jgi:uncharacterized protein (DUF488 family)